MLLHVLRLQRVAGLQRVDALVLGAVVFVDAADVRHEADAGDVADDDAEPDDALDDDHEQVAAEQVVQQVREEQRPGEEDAADDDEGDDHHAPHRCAAGLAVFLAQLDVGRPHQRPHAERQRLPEHDDAPDEGYAPQKARIDAAERLLARGDVAVGPAAGDGHRPRPPNHHALDDGLAAVVHALVRHRFS